MPGRYNEPAEGADNWHVPLNENWAALDVDVEHRDSTDPDSAGITPEAGAKFLDTSTGEIYTADGSSWTMQWNLGNIGSGSGGGDHIGSATDPVLSITNTHYREVTNTASVSGNHTVDFSNANVHHLTLTGDTQLSFTGDHTDLTTSCTLVLEQDSTGGHTVTWPTGVNWPNGSGPSLPTDAGIVHRLVIDNIAGTWFGMVVGENFDAQWQVNEIDFFERDSLTYYEGGTGAYSISTSQAAQGDSSLATTSTDYTNGIASHPGDGLPNYPGMGDTFRYYVYPQDSTHAGMVTFAIPDGSLPHQNGYYIRVDVGDTRFGIGYEDSTNHAELADTTSASIPTNEWVRIEVTRTWTNGTGSEIQIDAVAYDSTDTQIASLTGQTDSSAGDPIFDDTNRGIGMTMYNGGGSNYYFDGFELI